MCCRNEEKAMRIIASYTVIDIFKVVFISLFTFALLAGFTMFCSSLIMDKVELKQQTMDDYYEFKEKTQREIKLLKGGIMLERVKRIVSEALCVRLDKIVPAARLEEDLEADSLDLIELQMGLEGEFEIKIPDVDAEKMITVQDIVTYIQDRSGD